jgi:hypothetical protein
MVCYLLILFLHPPKFLDLNYFIRACIVNIIRV